MCALVLSALFATGVAAASTPVITGSQFTDRIDRAIALAVAGRSAPSRDLMASVRAAVGLPVDVAVGDTVMLVASDAVLARLTGARASDFALVVLHLEALRVGVETAEASAGTSGPTPDVAAALRGTQTQPTFGQRLRELWNRLLGLIGRGLSRVAGSGWGAVLLVALACVVVASIVFAIMRRTRLVQERSTGAGARPVPEDPEKELADAIRRGDLAAAVRAQFLVLAHELAVDGVVPDWPSLTAGECRSAVGASRRSIYPLVAEATEAFERVAYGHADARSEHLEVLRRATEAVRAA